MTGLAEVLQPIVWTPSSASLGIDLGCNTKQTLTHALWRQWRVNTSPDTLDYLPFFFPSWHHAPIFREHLSHACCALTGTGRYKDQEPADPGYRLAPHIWEQIGVETAAAYRTIPSDFVGAMPDITKAKYKAEYWSFWTIHLAPILLQHTGGMRKFYLWENPKENSKSGWIVL